MINDNLKVKDDILAAVDNIISFSKNYCIDLKMSEAMNDICWRCHNCEFGLESMCMIRMFVHNNGTQKQIGDLHNNLIPTYIFKKEGVTKEL